MCIVFSCQRYHCCLCHKISISILPKTKWKCYLSQFERTDCIKYNIISNILITEHIDKTNNRYQWYLGSQYFIMLTSYFSNKKLSLLHSFYLLHFTQHHTKLMLGSCLVKLRVPTQNTNISFLYHSCLTFSLLNIILQRNLRTETQMNIASKTAVSKTAMTSREL